MKRLLLAAGLLAVQLSMFAQGEITIDASKTFQTIEGLGGYGPFAGSYTDRHFQQVMDNMGVTMIRIDLPDDFVTSAANLASNTVNSGPTSTTGKKYVYVQKAKARGDVKFITTVWSPPAFMKKNNKVMCECCLAGQAYSCDTQNYLTPSKYSDFAKYIGLFAKDFKAQHGIDIYALSIQNEPMFNEPYPSALLYALPYANLLKVVGPYFKNDAALSGINFFGPEHMCQYGGNSGGSNGYLVGQDASKYIQYVLDDATTRQYLHAYAVHGYVGGVSIDLGTAGDWTQFANKTTAYGKKLWMTETGVADGWTGSYNAGKGMFLGLKYGQVSGWTFWVLADNMMNEDVADSRTAVGKQFFRFIRPGYQQIGATDATTGIASMAFKNGSDMTVVLFNEGSVKKSVTLKPAAGTTLPPSFQMYRSCETEYCAYWGSVTNYTFDLPPMSITTLYYKASEPTVQWGPNKPATATAGSITETSVRLSWTVPADWTINAKPSSYSLKTTGYYVYKKNDNGLWTKVNDMATTNLYYSIAGLKPGFTYTYAIVARDELFNMSARKEITFKTNCSNNCPDTTQPIAVSEFYDPYIAVFPNPSTGLIQVSGADNSTVMIADMNGTVVLSRACANEQEAFDLATLADGMYIVKVIKESKVTTRKLLLHK